MATNINPTNTCMNKFNSKEKGNMVCNSKCVTSNGNRQPTCKVKKGINILMTNGDQIGNKMDLLRARIAAYKPDIVCINEVKPKNSRYQPFAAEFNLDDIGLHV